MRGPFLKLLFLFLPLFLLASTGCVVKNMARGVALQDDSFLSQMNLSEIHGFAQWAHDVYETNEVLRSTYDPSQLIIRDLSHYKGRYFVLLDHARSLQTISIRGTSNKKNALVDAESIKILDPKLNIYLHKGFKKAAVELYQDVLPFLQKDYRTRITGHSLGGAMAVILTMYLIEDGYDIDQVITFGQPKVTNEAGGKKYRNVTLLRVINDQDIVPHVPPSDLIFDWSGPYTHLGPEMILKKGENYTVLTRHEPKEFFSENNWKNLDLDNVLDHKMENYLSRIESYE